MKITIRKDIVEGLEAFWFMIKFAAFVIGSLLYVAWWLAETKRLFFSC